MFKQKIIKIIRIIIQQLTLFKYKITSRSDTDQYLLNAEFPCAGKYLIIAPHADDELLGTYCIIMNHLVDVKIIHCDMTGSNYQEENRNIRKKEIANFCNENNVPLISTSTWKEQLLKEIEMDPQVNLIIPSYIDWHPEHRAINTGVCEILKHCNTDKISIFWYSISIPIVSRFALPVYLSRQEQRNKYKSFEKYYQSQSNMPIGRFMVHEIINAKPLKWYAAELYYPVNSEQINRAISSISVDELNKLRDDVNDIQKIRMYSKKLYLKIN